MLDVNDVIDLGFQARSSRRTRGAFTVRPRKMQSSRIVSLRTHEEIAELAREHDRFVRGVNPLIAKRNGCFAQPLPSVTQIVREFLRQSRFSGRPAVVLFSVLNPSLAVVALSTGHTSEL